MRRISTLLSILFLLLTLSFPKNVSAQTDQEYKVRSVILIPANFDNEDTAKKIPKYKTIIAKAIKDVQVWYASKLPGNKTFKFNEQDIEVVKSKKQLTSNSANTWRDLENLGGANSFPLSINTVYVVWIIGSNDNNPTGDAFYFSEQTNEWRYFVNPKISSEYAKYQDTATKLIGFAVMNEHTLRALNEPNYGGIHNKYLAILAHELAHAFGLPRDGYAVNHSCTELSKSECLLDTPQPLPEASEWYGSILGYGSFGHYPNVSFNNSLVNPEMYSLLKNSFLNAERTELPAPVKSVVNSVYSDIIIKSIEPRSVKVGDIVTIYGSGFGKVKAGSHIILVKSQSKSVDEIISWSDNEIKFVVPDGAETGHSISINKTFSEWDGEKAKPVMKKIIYPKPIEVIEPPENFLNINIPYALTCGENNQLLEFETYPADPIIELEGHLKPLNSTFKEGRILLQVVPNSSTGVLSYSVLKRREPGNFSVRLKSIGDLKPSYSGHYPVSLDDLNNPDYRVNLHYENCPGKELIRVALIEKESEIGQEPKDVSEVVVLFENGQFLEEQDLNGLKVGDNLFLIKKCFKDGSCEVVENSLMIFRVTNEEVDEEEEVEKPLKISYPNNNFPVYDNHDVPVPDNAEEKSCPAEYNQCGKTYGLEEDEFDPNQTVRITPVCDGENNIIEYQKRLLLEGEEGWDACLDNEQL